MKHTAVGIRSTDPWFWFTNQYVADCTIETFLPYFYCILYVGKWIGGNIFSMVDAVSLHHHLRECSWLCQNPYSTSIFFFSSSSFNRLCIIVFFVRQLCSSPNSVVRTTALWFSNQYATTTKEGTTIKDGTNFSVV